TYCLTCSTISTKINSRARSRTTIWKTLERKQASPSRSRCIFHGTQQGRIAQAAGESRKDFEPVQDMTGHGFRALAMTTIKERLGYWHEIVDRQLAHVPKKAVDKAYDRAQFLSERYAMMQHWGDFLQGLI